MSPHPLIRRQLRKAFAGDAPDLPGLAALTESVSSAYTAADDDRRQLEHSLALASEELVERNRKLEGQIAELTRLEKVVARRTEQLDQRNHDMALILDNVAQGFVTAGLDGSIGNECSRALIRWFGAPSELGRIWTYLAGHDVNLSAWIELGFDSLHSDAMEHDVVLGQLPALLDRDGRHFRIEYLAIGEPLVAVLVVVSDITEEVVRGRAERSQRELLGVIERAYRDRPGVLAFIHETNQLVLPAAYTKMPLTELARQIHTLKGNAALFGVVSISEVCHQIETSIEVDGGVEEAHWAQLCDTWHAFHDRIDNLLGVSERRAIAVDWEEYRSVIGMLGNLESPWASRIRRWGQDPTRSHLERLAEQARQLAYRRNNAELDVEIRDNGVRLDRERFAPIWAAAVHAVHNAIDHGIESTDQRLAASKQARAQITFCTEERGGELILEIQDDGAGIDWHAVASRAAALGLPSVTRRDLIDALFADGLSTAHKLTQTSGRGVGMSALRAACTELGGSVELVSEPGRGTTVRCILPLARPKPPADATAHRLAISL
jgi:two-component system chemotaxis sensor kinase CheA